MQPDAPALLWQAHRAARITLDFVSGRTFEDYEHDPMLKSAVERQFQIIGEALNRLKPRRFRDRWRLLSEAPEA